MWEYLKNLYGSRISKPFENRMKEHNLNPEDLFYVKGHTNIPPDLVMGECIDKENKGFICPPDIKEWRDKNTPKSFCVITGSEPLIAFENEADAIYFKMVWG